MRAKSILVTIAAAGCIAVLTACSYTTQTTSGREWLGAVQMPAGKPGTGTDIDAQVRRVAAVEPTLRFPARIGIARMVKGPYDGGSLAAPTGAEGEAWLKAAQNLGPEFGEFVPVSPLIAAMVAPGQTRATGWTPPAQRVIEAARLAAARQHLDAIILYEVDATADSKNNPLSIADWTLIGAFILPSQDVKAQGVASAILLDVRNGYHYGTVQATADDKGLSARFSTRDAEAELSARVSQAVVVKLAGETEAMLRKLRPQLAALDAQRRPARRQ